MSFIFKKNALLSAAAKSFEIKETPLYIKSLAKSETDIFFILNRFDNTSYKI